MTMKTPHPDPWWRSHLAEGRRICAQGYIGSGGFAALATSLLVVGQGALVRWTGCAIALLAVGWLLATISFHRGLNRLDRASRKMSE